MSPKVLLILLIVIAVLTAMFIGVGYRRDRTDRKYEQKSAFSGLDRVFGGFRDPFEVSRISGCRWDGKTFTLDTSDCEVAIAPGKARSSAFTLVPASGIVRVCFGFERDQLTECVDGDEDERTRLASDNGRFVVGRDSAILRLYCSPVGGNPCLVRLTLEE